MRAEPPNEPQSTPDSVLRRVGIRPLPVALAHRVAATEPDDPHLATLIRIFLALSRAEQFDFMFEMIRAGVGRRSAKVV